MTTKRPLLIALQAIAVLAFAALALAQTPDKASAEQADFQAARTEFDAQHFAPALTAFKKLIAEHSANEIYKKYACEAAIDTGDMSFAVATLIPLEQAHPADWQVRMLLARAYAQTADEPGHREERDKEVAEIIRLHLATPDSQLGKLRDFRLEDVHEGSELVQLYPALTPWGPYRVHLIARFFSGTPPQPGLRVTLESSDGDQQLFAKEHPAEAAAGKRSFSLDGYAPDRTGSDGRTIQTHYTYAFLVGEPTYDDVRGRILEIAKGRLKPLSSRVGPAD